MKTLLIVLLAVVFPIAVIAIIVATVVSINRDRQRNTQHKPQSRLDRPRYRTLTDRRGDEGERYIRSVLGETVMGERYIAHDFIFEKDYLLTQIDHIVVNTYGIFVIETKNMVGYIYGDDDKDKWTQVCDDGTVRVFESPVKQNEKHVNIIKSVLGDTPIYSIVVFAQDNIEDIRSDYVVASYQLKRALCQGKPTLNDRQMRTIYESLQRYRSKMSHEEFEQRMIHYKTALQNNICPRCGGNLVIRNGKYGEFYGCSNYPKCKFIKRQ